ncbi:MAG TPA: hypothetical protein VF592_01085 [Sphingomonas sp.]|jgi:hypothetical protein|uniref:hypothetical protein n=1 Tax=Sphingomonas sp. TaxID=28214 RepID=UPI002ED822A3
MASAHQPAVDSGDESLIILQSLLCLLREKNVLSRADLEELSRKVELRATGAADGPLPCCPDTALAASQDMQRVTSYLGRLYGGKHARTAS